MYHIKKLLFLISDNLVRILVYATATVTVLVFVLGSRADVKNAISVSGAYQKFVPSVIESNKDQQEASSIPLEDPEVVAIINDSFPPDNLKNNTEIIIDSIFDWLEGKSDTVKFSVDFTENKNKLGDGLSEYAFTNLAFKDSCENNPEFFDPFTTECRPEGYDIFEGQKQFASQIKASEGFLGKTIFTEQDLPKDDGQSNIFQRYSYAPNVYKWLMRAPWILGLLTVLAAISFVTFSRKRRKGVSSLGRVVVGSSLTLIITPLIFGFILPRLSNNYVTEISGSSSEVLLNDIISTITSSIDRMMIGFGVWLSLIGLAIIVAEKMTRDHARYRNISKKSGLLSSDMPRNKFSSPKGKIAPDTLPMQSSEVSVTKKPKPQKKNSKYRNIRL